jgi:hypothetical protein
MADAVVSVAYRVVEELVLAEVEGEREGGEGLVVRAGDVSQALQSRDILLGDQLADGGVGGEAGQPEAGDALDLGGLLLLVLRALLACVYIGRRVSV